MYMLVMSAILTLAILKLRTDVVTEGDEQLALAERIDRQLLVNELPISKEYVEVATGDTGSFTIVYELEGIENIETFEWPMEDYGVEVPMDCHIPPDFTQPELQEACVHWDVPKSECDQFLKFAWETSADFVHPALGLRPGCLD
ncbi:hypothetical protein KBC55_01170 [Patescibacteria group bacterium]|nr:hypothetical protein [Patescibacteria group bacterium]